MLCIRLAVQALACCAVQGVGNCCKCRRKKWLTQAGWFVLVFYKINFYFPRRILLPYHFVLMEVPLAGQLSKFVQKGLFGTCNKVGTRCAEGANSNV